LCESQLCHEVGKGLQNDLTLNAALAEMIGEVETGRENYVFLETNGKVSPLNEAIL
jgi:hypothetical protein